MANKIIKDVNFLEPYYRKPKIIEQKKSGKSFVLIPVLLFLIVASVFAFYFSGIIFLSEDINGLNSFIASPQNNASFSKSQTLLGDIEMKTKTLSGLDTQLKLMQYGVKMDINTQNTIYSCNSPGTFISAVTFYKSAQSLSLQLESISQFDVNEFVKRLSSTKLFSAVNYNGYTYNETSQKYTFIVDCTFSVK